MQTHVFAWGTQVTFSELFVISTDQGSNPHTPALATLKSILMSAVLSSESSRKASEWGGLTLGT